MAKYRTQRIQLDDRTPIFVEVEEVELAAAGSDQPQGLDEEGFPLTAERTSRISDRIDDVLGAIESQIRAFSGAVQQGFETAGADEFTLELQIGFKGTTSPIPVILSGEANGALKVTAKWTSSSPPPPKSGQ